MPTRNVVLTERQEELIETLVKSGRYQNASEVLCDGLRLVEQSEAEHEGKLKALRQQLVLASAHRIEATSKNSKVSETCGPI
jgi:putative addiction module CopG family antidote